MTVAHGKPWGFSASIALSILCSCGSLRKIWSVMRGGSKTSKLPRCSYGPSPLQQKPRCSLEHRGLWGCCQAAGMCAYRLGNLRRAEGRGLSSQDAGAGSPMSRRSSSIGQLRASAGAARCRVGSRFSRSNGETIAAHRSLCLQALSLHTRSQCAIVSDDPKTPGAVTNLHPS